MERDTDESTLTAYALGELDAPACLAVEARLVGDDRARRFVREIRATARLVTRHLKIPAHEELTLTASQRDELEQFIAGLEPAVVGASEQEFPTDAVQAGPVTGGPARSRATTSRTATRGFWRRRAEDLTPLLGSVAAHAAAVLIGLATLSTIHSDPAPSDAHASMTRPADLDMNGMGLPSHDPWGGDPMRMAGLTGPSPLPDSTGWVTQDPGSLMALAVNTSADQAPVTRVIGAGDSITFGQGIQFVSGSSVRNSSNAGYGPSAPWGVPAGQPTPPASMFAGPGASPASVAFVCDASGSMFGEPFDLLKDEIRKAVASLKPIQFFDIVFFRDRNFVALSTSLRQRDLLLAGDEHKRKVDAFLADVIPTRETNPLPALRHALRERPAVIYVLTDGVFANNDEVLTTIRQLNRDKSVRINTIAFFRPGQTPSERSICQAVLKQIAEENRGSFKVVDTSDLK